MERGAGGRVNRQGVKDGRGKVAQLLRKAAVLKLELTQGELKRHQPHGDHLFKMLLHQDLGACFHQVKNLGARGIDAHLGNGPEDA